MPAIFVPPTATRAMPDIEVDTCSSSRRVTPALGHHRKLRRPETLRCMIRSSRVVTSWAGARDQRIALLNHNPSKPLQSRRVESLNERPRDDCLNQVVSPKFSRPNNEERNGGENTWRTTPQELGYLTPAALPLQ